MTSIYISLTDAVNGRAGQACETGYFEQNGDVAGSGLAIHRDTATSKECAQHCNGNVDCNSYEHSTADQDCKLLDEKAPTHEKFEDYTFCTKGNTDVLKGDRR